MIKINDYCILKDETTKLNWNSYTRKPYEELGYVFTKIGEEFEIKIIDVLKGSDKMVDMICPICGKEFKAQIRKMYTNNKNDIPTPNTICSSGCHILHKHKDDKCESCGAKNVVFRMYNGKRYCDTCHNKMIRKGEMYKSITELNDIVYYNDFAEIVLRNSYGDIVGNVKIDLEDVEKIKNIKWRKGVLTYVYGVGGTHNSLKLHRVIMDTPKDMQVDHIYHNPLDNRKKYLRNVTKKENLDNRRKKEDITIRMSGIKSYAIEDGVGIRMSLYSCMCPHRCKGCHNPQTWDYESGYDETVDSLYEKIVNNKHIDGVTFSGGDPFVQWKQFYDLAVKIKNTTKLNIWCYTGYTYEELMQDDRRLLVEQVDVLVDGKFIEAKKDLKLRWRGSSNQRIINVQESLKQGKVVERVDLY